MDFDEAARRKQPMAWLAAVGGFSCDVLPDGSEVIRHPDVEILVPGHLVKWRKDPPVNVPKPRDAARLRMPADEYEAKLRTLSQAQLYRLAIECHHVDPPTLYESLLRRLMSDYHTEFQLAYNPCFSA